MRAMATAKHVYGCRGWACRQQWAVLVDPFLGLDVWLLACGVRRTVIVDLNRSVPVRRRCFERTMGCDNRKRRTL